MSTAASSDPIAKAFFNPQVQETLKSLTGLNYEKIFRVSRLGQRLDPPSYSFMTDEELKEARREIKVKALKMLQMPPVMSERKDEVKGFNFDLLKSRYSEQQEKLDKLKEFRQHLIDQSYAMAPLKVRNVAL